MSFAFSAPPPIECPDDDGKNSPQTSPFKQMPGEEWVEIVEPKSKTKIYANLDSGFCAKNPPEGVSILKADDFTDHWWELFDKKTGRYYYYNPKQQKTVWTKPTLNGKNSLSTNGSNDRRSVGRRLLIIPVSRLQTFKKLSPATDPNRSQPAGKSDASTQTIASNLVTTGTQTFSESDLSTKLNEIDINESRDKKSAQKESLTPKPPKAHPSSKISSKIAEYQNVFKAQQQPITNNHRKVPDIINKTNLFFSKANTIDHVDDAGIKNSKDTHQSRLMHSFEESQATEGNKIVTNENKSSQSRPSERKLARFYSRQQDDDQLTNHESAKEHLTNTSPVPSKEAKDDSRTVPTSQKNYTRRSVHLRESTTSSFRPDDSSTSINAPQASSTSTFKNSRPLTTIARKPPNTDLNQLAKSVAQNDCNRDPQDQKGDENSTQPLVTNNLSHYLVREARAMGIALISDDELDDDDQDSEDDCANDDDEDTDLRDDLSSNRCTTNEGLNTSQELHEDSNEGGWRSFSDRESPNALVAPHPKQRSNFKSGQKSAKSQVTATSITHPDFPVKCETFTGVSKHDNSNRELIDDHRNPAAGRSQQLDHRKLVDNFKKTRHTSALGFNDSLSRSYRLDANNAVQKLKTVADTYFSNSTTSAPTANATSGITHSGHSNREHIKSNEKYLRRLSTLSTLPRPIKTKPPQVPANALDYDIDADYDVVEENCGYYSDSDRVQAALNDSSASNQLDTSKNSSNNSRTSGLSNLPNNEPSSPVTSYFDRNKSTRGSTFSVESFARENLARHPKKGGLLFNRKVKWSRMISWTKNSIKQPMISSVSNELNAESISAFKIIQQFMGDRKITMSKKYRQLLTQSGLSDQEISSLNHRKTLGRSSSISASNTSHNQNSNANNSNLASHNNVVANSNYMPDRLRDELAYELTVRGCTKSELRDEIFVQLARQLTDNPNVDSTNWGLVLMSILLNYFSPSNKFAPFLLSFLETHGHQMARDVCLPRLEKRLRQTWLTYCRKPADGKEISIVRLSITKWPQYCGIFGESLERIMSLQMCSVYLKTLRLPWILTTLGDKLLETGGQETEGIFRCAADHDLLAQLRLEIDCVDFRKITDAQQLKGLLSNVDDPHVIAGLLKLFFRQLFEPVFPARLYDVCLLSCRDATMACRLFNERLPNLNKDVIAYLIRLLQLLAEQDKVINTKMDTANLSMVWAPNLLRAPEKGSVLANSDIQLLNCSSNDTSGTGGGRSGSKWSILNASTGGVGGVEDASNMMANMVAGPSPSQSMIFEQTRQEMQFIKLLITNLDTSFIENVL